MSGVLRNLALAALLVFFAGPAFAADLSPLGQWQVTTGEARYKVTICQGGRLCAKLTWLRPDQRTTRNLAFLNTYVVRGASATKPNSWAGEVVFDGHSYDGVVTMVSKNFMTLQGCSGILCQTYEFTRI